jgi:hypothetical protein
VLRGYVSSCPFVEWLPDDLVITMKPTGRSTADAIKHGKPHMTVILR